MRLSKFAEVESVEPQPMVEEVGEASSVQRATPADTNILLERIERAMMGDNRDVDIIRGQPSTSVYPPSEYPSTVNVNGVFVPTLPFDRIWLFSFYEFVSTIKLAVDTAIRELFKNKLVVRSYWHYKCKNKNCKYEYEKKPKVGKGGKLKCIKCGGTSFDEPDLKQWQEAKRLKDEEMNDNHQSFVDVSMQWIRHALVADDAYVLKQIRYIYEGKKLKSYTLSDKRTIYPPFYYKIADRSARLGMNRADSKAYICPYHRMDVQWANPTKPHKTPEIKWNREWDAPQCMHCGREMIEAVGYVSPTYATSTNATLIPVADIEVNATSGFLKSDDLYGLSVIYAIKRMARVLMANEEYLEKYSDLDRPPKSLMVLGTKDVAMARKTLMDTKQQVKEDPYATPVWIVSAESADKNIVQYLNLTGDMSDLQMTEIRSEFKRQIMAMWGVTPLFSGDIAEGWSDGSTEIMVLNRALMLPRNRWLEKFSQPLCRDHGITDWYIDLDVVEQNDKSRALQEESATFDNAAKAKELGFEIEFDSNGDLITSMQPMEDPPGDDGGGFGSGSGSSATHKPNTQTTDQGEPSVPVSSDKGGVGQGAPASGRDTSKDKRRHADG